MVELRSMGEGKSTMNDNPRRIRIECPSCKSVVEFSRSSNGQWLGTIAGGGLGLWLASGLGLAGGILGAPIAIPATFVGLGVGAIIGNRTGALFDGGKCPNCGKSISL